jgi:hypothetical protein
MAGMDAAKNIKLKTHSIVLFTFCSIWLKIENINKFLQNTEAGLVSSSGWCPVSAAPLSHPEASPGLHYFSFLFFLEEIQIQLLLLLSASEI